MKIKNKISLSFATLFLLFICVCVFVLWSINSVGDDLDKLYKHPLAVNNSARAVDGHIIGIHRAMKDFLLSNTEDEKERYKLEVDKHELDALRHFEIIQNRYLGDKADVAVFKEAFIKWRPLRIKVIDNVRIGRRDLAIQISQEEGALYASKLELKSASFVKFASEKAKGFQINSNQRRGDVAFQVLCILILTLIVLIIVGFHLIKVTTLPLLKIIEFAVKVKDGDFSTQINLKGDHEVDTLVVSLNGMVRRLKEYHKERGDVNKSLALRSKELEQSNKELRVSTQQLELQYALVEKRTAELNQASFLTTKSLELAHAGSWHMDIVNYPNRLFVTPDLSEIQGEILPKGVNYILTADWEANVLASNELTGRSAINLFTQALSDPDVSYDATWQYSRKIDGNVIWLHALAQIVRDENGDAVSVFGVTQDVTKQKNDEEYLKIAKVVAEAANIAKSQFLANMSHEIRTPMNAIIGLSYLALRKTTDPKQKDYLEKIHSSSNALLGIINDILDFSKIEAGMVKIEMVVFDLSEIISQVINVFAQSARDKKIRLKVNFPSSIPRKLEGDPLRIRQILTNLVGNAIKFTEKGHISVGVKVLGRVDNQLKIQFSVSDTGIGMSPEQCKHVFEAFSQADCSTTRRFGGTGLGLTITQNLVRLMNGKLTVVSELEKGTEFTFTLSLGEDGHEIESDVVKNVVPDLSGMAILVVDDDEMSLEVVLGLLKGANCEIKTAINGHDAVTKIKNSRFDLVLMDVQMPVMDGIEATKRIRCSEMNGKYLPIIAMTAGALNSDRERALEAGMDEHLSKPLVPAVLYEELLRWRNSTL